jgi:sucrose-6-phosphate hydrolase SacC (GH32 family)
MKLKHLLVAVALLCAIGPAFANPKHHDQPFRLADKSLVAWVVPLSADPGFMGVFCIMENSTFDGIALTGGTNKQWISWSDFLRRTAKGQTNWPIETVATQTSNTPICVVTVYKDNAVSVYRNGKLFLSYPIEPQPFFQFSKAMVGFDHQFPCEIHELRLYDVALTPEQVSSLRLNTYSGPAPLAQWTFEDGSLADSRGCFQKGELRGNVKVHNGKLVFATTKGATFSAKLPPDYRNNPKEYQTAFYTAGFKEPNRMGQLWDTWVYYHQGRYYQYFDAGVCGSTDQYDLAVSDDGVVWKEIGKVLQPKPEAFCIGTGTIIEAPNPAGKSPTWQLNYTEYAIDGKQSIMFATSSDLIHWDKLGESFRFHPDTNWYDPGGRWDCLDYLRLDDGTLYGYFTANPRGDKVDYQACGFGLAESKDGIRWKALPPPAGNIGGEIGGIQKIGSKYYVSVGGGQIGVSDSPRGPFLTQKKNPHAFGQQCDVGFPRFFHNPPVEKTLNRNGALMSHFFWGSLVYSAPLKAIEIDAEDTFRIKWWQQNNRLKKITKALSLTNGEQSSVRMFREEFNLDQVGVIEANVSLAPDEHEKLPRGFYFEKSANLGYAILFNRTETAYGLMSRDGSAFTLFARVKRDMDFGQDAKVRVIVKHDMMEAYVNDYLVMVKRAYWNGRLGVIGQADTAEAFRAWTHE